MTLVMHVLVFFEFCNVLQAPTVTLVVSSAAWAVSCWLWRDVRTVGSMLSGGFPTMK